MPDGARLADALDDIATSSAAAALLVDTSDYVELFSPRLAGRVVRRPPRPGARVRILGLLEARLTESDRVVLGGLVEGTWPPESRSDAWLSRPMRLSLGLDLPERRIGLTAHDFAQLLGAPEVILTHAAKIAGTPTVPSRFIQRLAAVAGPRWQAALERGKTYLAWARELDRPEQQSPPAPQPAPKPPRAARPTRSFGHRHRTLAARPLHDLCQAHPASDAARSGRCRARGRRARHGHPRRHRRIHAALRERPLPADPMRELIALGRAAFRRAGRFSGSARVLVAALRTHRALVRRLGERAAAGNRGHRRGNPRQIEIPVADGAFRLRGIADRIERQRRRPLRHPRLQDRLGADRKAGADRARAAAHARKRRCCAMAVSRTLRPAARSPRSFM